MIADFRCGRCTCRRPIRTPRNPAVSSCATDPPRSSACRSRETSPRCRSSSISSRRSRSGAASSRAPTPPRPLLARLCDSSNPRSQLTLIVSRIVGGASRIIATGSYAAGDETTAEVAFAVDDEFQGKGPGRPPPRAAGPPGGAARLRPLLGPDPPREQADARDVPPVGLPAALEGRGRVRRDRLLRRPERGQHQPLGDAGPRLHHRLAPSLLPAAIRRGHRRLPRHRRASATAFSTRSSPEASAVRSTR